MNSQLAINKNQNIFKQGYLICSLSLAVDIKFKLLQIISLVLFEILWYMFVLHERGATYENDRRFILRQDKSV